MDITYLLQLPKVRCREIFIKRNYPDDYKKIMNMEGERFVEKLYNYVYNSPEHICPVCGNRTSFRNFTVGYSNFCSVKCSAGSEETRGKYKSTVLEKYGVDNISQLNEIKQLKKSTMQERYGGYYTNREKARNTTLEKYGVDNISQLDEIKQLKKSTMQERYGCYFNNPKQAKKTMMEKYGYASTLVRPDVREKIGNTRRKNFLQINNEILDYDGDYWVMKCPHPGCTKCEEKTFKIKQGHYHDRLRVGAEICTKLLPIKDGRTSNTSLEIFVKNILEENGVEFRENDREVLNGKGIDIYIPNKKLAIECNGCYWHNDFLHHEPKKHYDKWMLCKEKGIQLLTIWEDWIRLKPEITCSIIKSKLGLISNKIYARKCTIKDLSSGKKVIKNFLLKNHIQGSTPFEKGFGLYYNGELVSVMTFGHKRGCRGNNKGGNEWELSRFCNKLDTIVVGGAGKLLKYFESHIPHTMIYSYSSNDISNGNLYMELNFIKSSTSIPYWYIEPKTLQRYHRTAFTKKEIRRKGMTGKEDFTESEIMKQYHFLKIYDSGMTKWEKHP